jgi:long-chain acyl-CoA synthetase
MMLSMKTPYLENETRTIPRIFHEAALEYEEHIAYSYRRNGKSFEDTSYGSLRRMVSSFAAGLQSMGLAGKKMFCISDNCPELAAAILASMASGGMDVEKENAFPASELARIVDIYVPDFVLLHDRVSQEKYEAIESLRGKTVIVIDAEAARGIEGALTFENVLETGRRVIAEDAGVFERLLGGANEDSPVTTVFTSGTTGTPKGVVLTQGNLTFAVCEFAHRMRLDDAESYLSVIHIRHIGEKFAVFMALTNGYRIILSSIKDLRADMKAERPQVLAGSPVMWKAFRDAVYRSIEEKGATGAFRFLYGRSLAFVRARRVLRRTTAEKSGSGFGRAIASFFIAAANASFHLSADMMFYRKVRAMTGGRVRVMASGGALLHDELDDFYEIVGLDLINGYGSNETTAVVTARDVERNIRHTIGFLVPRTEIRIVSPDTGEPCARGESGVLLVRGPQVFKEYMGNPEATQAVKDGDGWFRTGDIVREIGDGGFAFVGRSKDTISLTDRNNVEPEPIEVRLEGSTFIKCAIAIGQDRPRLVALLAPNFDNIRSTLRLDPAITASELCSREDVIALLRGEILREISIEHGFMPHELIAAFALVPDEWKPGDLMTLTMKKRRFLITEKYEREIEALYASTEHLGLAL